MKTKHLIELNILLITMLFSLGVQAQFSYPDTMITQTNYDTLVVYHHPIYDTCQMNYDIIPDGHHYWYVLDKTDFSYYNLAVLHLHPVQQNEDGSGWIYWPFELQNDCEILGKNNYKPEGFAQRWHFDSTVNVVGIAARVNGYQLNVDDEWDTTKYFRLFDTNFNQIAKSMNFIIAYSEDRITREDPLRWYFFGEKPYTLKDFYLAADEEYKDYTVRYSYARTCSIFDTLWQDTIIGCQAEYSPYLKKDGVWKSFASDSVYQYYQKCFIEYLPILLIPKKNITIDSLADDIVIQNLSIFPNPTNNEINIQSGFKVRNVEVYDLEGKLILQKELNVNESKLNISDLKSGYYTLKIITDRGYCYKTIIKQ